MDDSGFEVIATGLEFPEGGPIWLNDDSVLLVEIKRGTLTRVTKDGHSSVVAHLGGGPNSSGPDGSIYITQNGGFQWSLIGTGTRVLTVPGGQPVDYKTGSIQKVELSNNLEVLSVTTLYISGIDSSGNVVPLRGPNDLVFDSSGGFWFTDHGKVRERDRDVTGVFYAKIDGSSCKEIIFPLNSPNGIGLSPDGKILYVAETPTGRLYQFQVASPGVLTKQRGELLYSAPEGYMFDSLAIDSEGNICVATLGKVLSEEAEFPL